MKQNNSLVGVVDTVLEAAKDDQVSLDDLVKSVGHASFTALILVPALAVATPLSGIPLFSSLMGTLIFLVSIQMLLRRDHIWLPRWLLKRKFASTRIRATFTYLRPALSWLDARTFERLTIFSHRPLLFIPQTACVLSGLAMPFLELVPFSSTLIGIAVTVLAFGMLARDGLIVAIGLLPYVALFWLLSRLM